MAVKPTPQQAAKLKRGKLLNQRFRFKKDEEESGNLRGFGRFYKKEEAAAINNEGLRILDELKNIGAMSGSIESERQIPSWEALIMNKHNIQPLKSSSIEPVVIKGFDVDYDKMTADEFEGVEPVAHIVYGDESLVLGIIDKMDTEGEGAPEPHVPSKISPDQFPHIDEVAPRVNELGDPIKTHVGVLRARYDELVTELAMIVSDRIKSFKKRSIVMAKITGEEYGFLEESCWSTSETTTFKYWPASWKFERCIGTNTIFEARFHHTTFELLSYCTVFAYDPKTVITRNPNKYSLDNDDDLLAIISIYEKAICIVYSKGRK